MTKILLAGASALALCTPLFGPASAAPMPLLASGASAPMTANPLLAPWTGPYGGYPAFDKVKVEDFKPAIEAAIAENRREIAAIADNPHPATFENTIAALERSGQTLGRVQTIYGIWGSNLSTPEYQKVQDEMDPKLAAFGDEITQNAKLFARIEAVYNSPAKAKLTPEQQRLTWLYWNSSIRQGAKLDAKCPSGDILNRRNHM
jgi:peptidyl-dipeptidase Dcp